MQNVSHGFRSQSTRGFPGPPALEETTPHKALRRNGIVVGIRSNLIVPQSLTAVNTRMFDGAREASRTIARIAVVAADEEVGAVTGKYGTRLVQDRCTVDENTVRFLDGIVAQGIVMPLINAHKVSDI